MALKGANLGANKYPNDIADLVSSGADLVRWNCWCPTADVCTWGEYAEWLENVLQEIESSSTAYRKVICLFTPPGGSRWANSAYWQSRFIDVWRRIVKRLKGRKDIFGYDLVNEPSMDAQLWWDLARRLCKDLKKIDSKKLIVTSKFGTVANLVKRKPFYEADYFTIHIYAPMSYTHQGVGDRPYPVQYTPGEATRELKQLKTWADKYKVKIFIGEFSAVRWAPDSGLWLQEVIRFIDQEKWDWTYHAWREAHMWDLELSDAFDPDGVHAFDPRQPTSRFRVLEAAWQG